MKLVTYTLFFALELLIIITAMVIVLGVYLRMKNNSVNFGLFLPFQYTTQVGITLSCLSSLILLSDAIRRLRNCMIKSDGALAMSVK